MSSSLKGKIQTVLGVLDPDLLGYTLTHEHLLHDLKKTVFYNPLPSHVSQVVTKCPKDITLQNLPWIRQYPYSFEYNMNFCDEDAIQAIYEEMTFYKSVGGSSIVENSSIGLRAENQAEVLKRLSEETGINIITGTGFYVSEAHDTSTLNFSVELVEKMIKEDILNGINGSSVKCGVIGEIGCSWPLLPFEKVVLEASASVQEELGCPAIIHPGRNKNAPEEIMRIFQEAGGKSHQTVMSHIDRTFTTKEELAEFASNGCFCEMDLFGIEVSHYQLADDVDMPSDAQRVLFLKYLVDQGFSQNIVVSHDIHTKHRLMKFGGHGYSHIIVNIVPKMLKRGISKEVIEDFLVKNPKKWLTFH